MFLHPQSGTLDHYTHLDSSCLTVVLLLVCGTPGAGGGWDEQLALMVYQQYPLFASALRYSLFRMVAVPTHSTAL